MKIEYKTDVQRRLAEILDALNIKATYYNNDGVFTIDGTGFVIVEEGTSLSLICCVSCQEKKAGKIIRQFTNSYILG